MPLPPPKFDGTNLWDGTTPHTRPNIDIFKRADGEVGNRHSSEIIELQDQVANINNITGILSNPGAANSILGVKNDQSDLEYKSFIEGSNITITHGVGTVTISSYLTPAVANQVIISTGTNTYDWYTAGNDKVLESNTSGIITWADKSYWHKQTVEPTYQYQVPYVDRFNNIAWTGAPLPNSVLTTSSSSPVWISKPFFFKQAEPNGSDKVFVSTGISTGTWLASAPDNVLATNNTGIVIWETKPFFYKLPSPTVDDQIFISTGGGAGSWHDIGTGLQETGGNLTTNDAAIDHDSLLNFVANEHIDWTSATENFATSGTVNAGTLYLDSWQITAPTVAEQILISDSVDVSSWVAAGNDEVLESNTSGVISWAAKPFFYKRPAPTADDQIFISTAAGSGSWHDIGTGLQETGGNLTTNDAAIDHDSLLNFVANEHIDWTNASQDFLTSGEGEFTNGLGIGAPKLSGRALYVYHTVTDVNNAHGIQLAHTISATVNGAYNARALTFVTTPEVSANITNSGSSVGVWCQSLADSGLAGTLYNQVGILANVGTYDGATGIIQNCAAARFILYHRAGTIDSGTILHLMEDGSGTLTTGYGIHDSSSLDWALEDDDKKIRLGATLTDFEIYSDGTDATLDATGDMFLNPSGNVKFGTYTANASVTIAGYITIKDKNGNTRQLAVVA